MYVYIYVIIIFHREGISGLMNLGVCVKVYECVCGGSEVVGRPEWPWAGDGGGWFWGPWFSDPWFVVSDPWFASMDFGSIVIRGFRVRSSLCLDVWLCFTRACSGAAAAAAG